MAHQSEHPEAAHTPRFTTALKDGAPSRIQVEVLTQFKPSAIGGITDRHGGAVSWERTLRWTGLTEGEAHVSWQSITAMRVDQD